MKVTGNSAATDDVLLLHTEMRGHRESCGPGGCGCEAQDTLHTQSLTENLGCDEESIIVMTS